MYFSKLFTFVNKWSSVNPAIPHHTEYINILCKLTLEKECCDMWSDDLIRLKNEHSWDWHDWNNLIHLYLQVNVNQLLILCRVHMCVLSHFRCIWLFVIPWTVASQAPLSMGFSRQEYWSGLPCPSSGDLPDPGIKPPLLISPAKHQSAAWKSTVSSLIRAY